MFLSRCSPGNVRTEQSYGFGWHSRIAGNLLPEVPTILSFPTLPRLLRSNMVKPTTPTFLSDPEAPPPTKPVVYSPVPTCVLSVSVLSSCWHSLTMRTLTGAILVPTAAMFTIVLSLLKGAQIIRVLILYSHQLINVYEEIKMIQRTIRREKKAQETIEHNRYAVK